MINFPYNLNEQKVTLILSENAHSVGFYIRDRVIETSSEWIRFEKHPLTVRTNIVIAYRIQEQKNANKT